MSAGVHIYFSSWSQSASQKVRTYLQTTASQTEGYIVCLLAMAMWLGVAMLVYQLVKMQISPKKPWLLLFLLYPG